MDATAMRKHILFIFITLALAWATSPVWAYELVSEYTIPVDDNDHVLGSLRDNYLVYNRGYMVLYNGMGKRLFDRKINAAVTPTMSENGKFLGLVTYVGALTLWIFSLALSLSNAFFNLVGWTQREPFPFFGASTTVSPTPGKVPRKSTARPCP